MSKVNGSLIGNLLGLRKGGIIGTDGGGELEPECFSLRYRLKSVNMGLGMHMSSKCRFCMHTPKYTAFGLCSFNTLKAVGCISILQVISLSFLSYNTAVNSSEYLSSSVKRLLKRSEGKWPLLCSSVSLLNRNSKLLPSISFIFTPNICAKASFIDMMRPCL